MAAFCTKCGTGLAPETKFCTRCGNPIAALASGAVTGGAATPWSTPPPAPPPPPAPAQWSTPAPAPEAAPTASSWSTPAPTPEPTPAASSWSTPATPPPPPAPSASGFEPVASASFQPVASSDYQSVAPAPPPPPPAAPAFSSQPAQPASASYIPVAAPPSVPPPQYSGASYPVSGQPPQKSSSAVKIILIVVGVLVLLGILIIAGLGFAAWRISRAVKVVNGSNGQFSIHTDKGDISAKSEENLSASELGVEIYPGSSVGRGGMKLDLPTGSMATGIYTTSDSKDQVVAFYKSRLGAESSVIDTSEGAVISATRGEQESIVVTVEAKSSEYDGKTKYSIVHTRGTKS